MFVVQRYITLACLPALSRPVRREFVARSESCASPCILDSLEPAILSTSSIRTQTNCSLSSLHSPSIAENISSTCFALSPVYQHYQYHPIARTGSYFAHCSIWIAMLLFWSGWTSCLYKYLSTVLRFSVPVPVLMSFSHFQEGHGVIPAGSFPLSSSPTSERTELTRR